MSLLPNKKVMPMTKKTIVKSEKVTLSQEVDKCANNLDDMKGAVVTVRRKKLDNFEKQSIGSTSWFNLDREFLKKFPTLEPDFYEIIFERGIEGQEIEPYKMFVVPFDTNKLNRLMRN